jgi:Ca2+-binding RTX toxin-like protein
VEALEERALLTVSPGFSILPVQILPPGISRNTTTATVNILAEDDVGDKAVVTLENNKVKVTLSVMQFIDKPQLGIHEVIFVTLQEEYYDPGQVSQINFYGRSGDDEFLNDTAIRSWAFGSLGKDHLVGGGGDDILDGGGDNDVLEGRGGNDQLQGGSGSDTYVYAGWYLGSDTIIEAANADEDALDFSDFELPAPAAGSKSVLPTGVSVDLASTSQQMAAGTQLWPTLQLTISDATGIEDVHGSSRGDKIWGNTRANVLDGDTGNDILYGREGDDQLYGGFGNDQLYGGTGKNSIHDGPGNDLVDFSQNAVAISFATDGGNDQVIGTPFDDQITGSAGNDRLEGRGGDDRLYGGYGDDQLYGGLGNDRLFGGPGTDALHGEAGNDWLEAGSPGETADGGTGAADWNAYVWAVGGAASTDVRQGGAPTCWLLAAVSGVARETDLGTRISYLGNYIYRVNFLQAGGQGWYHEDVYFDGTTNSGDPVPAVKGESWVLLHQRAYLQHIGVDWSKPSTIGGGTSDGILTALTGRSSWSYQPDGGVVDQFYIKTYLALGREVVAGTWAASVKPLSTSLLVAWHAYTVLGVGVSSATGEILTVRLRNPWGYDGGATTYGDPSDAEIVISWSDFTKSMSGYCIN